MYFRWPLASPRNDSWRIRGSATACIFSIFGRDGCTALYEKTISNPLGCMNTCMVAMMTLAGKMFSLAAVGRWLGPRPIDSTFRTNTHNGRA